MSFPLRFYQFLISVMLLLILSAFLPLKAQVAGISNTKIDGRETISVFFDDMQLFTKAELQSQFEVLIYDDETGRYQADTKGAWHLSKDGYRLSYYPVAQGSYQVTTKDFSHSQHNSVKNRDIYIGESGQSVTIVGRGPVLPLQNAALAVEMIGTQAVDIEYYAIDNLPLFLENNYIGTQFESWTLSRLLKEMTPSGIFRYKIPGDTDISQKSSHQIPLSEHIQPGAYLITVNPAGEIYKTIDARIVFISNIGLQARLYPKSTLIIGNQFEDNSPIHNASLEVWRNHNGKLQKSGSLCTFKNGLCELQERLKESDVVVVKQGGDVSILPMKEIALDLNEFAITGAPSTLDVAYLYSNRTLYRPGETITLNALLRDYDGFTLPEQPLNFDLITPQGKIYTSLTLEKSKEGFYQTEIKMPIDAKTGVWRVEARTDKSSTVPLGELKLFIEEFMPERMELILTGEDRAFNYDEGFDLTLESRYLFGAPAARNQYHIENEISINRTPFTAHKDWYAGIETFPYHLMASSYTAEGSLDINGADTTILSIPSTNTEDLAPASAVMKLAMTVNILDGDVLGITRELSRDFWPNDTLPVIRPLFEKDTLGYGAKADFELFTANSAGKIMPSNLLLTLKYQNPYCTWVYARNSGWDCHYNGGYEIKEQKVIQSNGAIDYSFSPNSWGQYVLEIKDIDSGFVSEYRFSGSWESSHSGQLAAAKPLHLNLSTQKPSFDAGDDIELTIHAPLAGNLTLLLEGTELLYHQNINVDKGETTLTIPMMPDWDRHDIYLSGLLLSTNETDEITRSMGIIPIKLNRQDRQLTPIVQFDPIVKPDQPVSIDITLSDADLAKLSQSGDSHLYATVSITDQGIINMTPQKPVSIFDAFFQQRRYSAEIIDYYSRLFKRGSGSLLSPQFGGDGGLFEEEESMVPNLTEMKTVSLSSELLSLENGKATITFDLPDFNGEALVDVKVFSKTLVGEVNDKITIRAPIIADVVSPRFIRVGDQSFVSLTIVNMSGNTDSVTLKLSSDQFDVDFNETINLQNEEKHFALIPIKLNHFAPFAEVVLDIQSNSFTATRHYQIGTVHKTELTTLNTRMLLPADNTWQRDLSITDHYSQDFKEFITVSRNPQINVLSYTAGLFEYPYGCSEQITSKAFPWLFKSNQILDQQKHAAYESAIARNPALESESFTVWEANMMKETIARLLNRQNIDGGFPLWNEGPSYLATSLYLTNFLTTAKLQYPHLIPDAALENAFSYLQQALNKTQEAFNRYGLVTEDDYQGLLTRNSLENISFAIWILAREGKIFEADIRFMQNLINRLSPLATTYLSGASYLLGNEDRGEFYVSYIFPKMSDLERSYGYYQSNVSEIALLLGVLNELTDRGFNISNDLKSSILSVLDAHLNHRQYFSTQDRYALIKLGLEMPEDPKPLSVVINGTQRELPANQPIAANDIATLKSEQSLFIEYQIEGYPKVPVQTTNFEMSFVKSFDKDLSRPLKVGDRITVTIKMSPSVNLPSGLLVDYIPGGFNLVNPHLLDITLADYYDDLGIPYEQQFMMEHEEFRFDRYLVSMPLKANQEYTFSYILEAAVPGEYEMPATMIEDMYLPQYHNLMVDPGKIIIENHAAIESSPTM